MSCHGRARSRHGCKTDNSIFILRTASIGRILHVVGGKLFIRCIMLLLPALIGCFETSRLGPGPRGEEGLAAANPWVQTSRPDGAADKTKRLLRFVSEKRKNEASVPHQGSLSRSRCTHTDHRYCTYERPPQTHPTSLRALGTGLPLSPPPTPLLLLLLPGPWCASL